MSRIFSADFSGRMPYSDCVTLWFRVFGYGLHLRWVSEDYVPLFSERYGRVKVLKVGKLWVRGLKTE